MHQALILGATFQRKLSRPQKFQGIDVYKELKEFGFKADIFDPEADPETFVKEYGFQKLSTLSKNQYDVVILAVSHDSFKELNPKELIKEDGVVFDVKGFYKDKDFFYL